MNFFNHLSDHSRSFSASRLIEKQATTFEPFYFFLYRYVALRIHLAIFIIYCLIHMQFEPLTCETNSNMDHKLETLYCYFNITFLFTNRDNEHYRSSYDQVFQGYTNYSSSIEYQHYYKHLLLIIFAIYFINMISNLFYYKVLNFKKNLFKCDYFDYRKTSNIMVRIVAHMMNIQNLSILLPIYFLFNIIPVVAICSTIILLDYSFNGKYIHLGLNLIRYYIYSDHEQADPFKDIFPIIAKCYFPYGGTSGTIQWLDAFCILKFNYLNQIVFSILWFFYVSLLILLISGTVWHNIIALFPPLRHSQIAHIIKLDQLGKHESAMNIKNINLIEFIILMNVSKIDSTLIL